MSCKSGRKSVLNWSIFRSKNWQLNKNGKTQKFLLLLQPSLPLSKRLYGNRSKVNEIAEIHLPLWMKSSVLFYLISYFALCFCLQYYGWLIID